MPHLSLNSLVQGFSNDVLNRTAQRQSNGILLKLTPPPIHCCLRLEYKLIFPVWYTQLLKGRMLPHPSMNWLQLSMIINTLYYDRERGEGALNKDKVNAHSPILRADGSKN